MIEVSMELIRLFIYICMYIIFVLIYKYYIYIYKTSAKKSSFHLSYSRILDSHEKVCPQNIKISEAMNNFSEKMR